MENIENYDIQGHQLLVSIIVPVFNAASYFTEAIESVIHQTYRNLEIIVIDDGSTDGSEALCEIYKQKDNRITIIHQNNEGLSLARNIGLDISKGDIIAFLDSDDTYHPAFIETMLNALIDTEADVVVCKYSRHNTDSRMKTDLEDIVYPSVGEGIYDRNSVLSCLVNDTINKSVWNKIYKKELWRDIRFPAGRVFEDGEVVFRIFELCNKVYVLDHKLYNNRIRPDSITNTISYKNVNDWILARSKIDSYIKSNIPAIFENKDIEHFRQEGIKKMISLYMKALHSKGKDTGLVCSELRKNIFVLENVIEIRKIGFRNRVKCFLIKHNPKILHIVYPMFYSLKYWVFMRS